MADLPALSGLLDTTPKHPKPPANSLESAERAIPNILANVEPQHDGTVELVASDLVRQLQDAGHTLAAAHWAVHNAVGGGRLQAKPIEMELPRIIGDGERHRGGSGEGRGQKGRAYILKGQPTPFEKLKMAATDSLWGWWRSFACDVVGRIEQPIQPEAMTPAHQDEWVAELPDEFIEHCFCRLDSPGTPDPHIPHDADTKTLARLSDGRYALIVVSGQGKGYKSTIISESRACDLATPQMHYRNMTDWRDVIDQSSSGGTFRIQKRPHYSSLRSPEELLHAFGRALADYPTQLQIVAFHNSAREDGLVTIPPSLRPDNRGQLNVGGTGKVVFGPQVNFYGIGGASVGTGDHKTNIGFVIYGPDDDDAVAIFRKLGNEAGVVTHVRDLVPDIEHYDDPLVLWTFVVFQTLRGSHWVSDVAAVPETRTLRFHLFASSVETLKRLIEKKSVTVQSNVAAQEHLPTADNATTKGETRQAGSDGKDCAELNRLNESIPALDDGSDDWILSRAAAKLLGIETETLANHRSLGQNNMLESESYGLHANGACFWRKDGNRDPRYYLPQMKKHAGQLVKIYPRARLDF